MSNPTPSHSPAGTTIFLNGQFLANSGDARISAFDAGFQHAVGVFETMIGGNTPGGEETWVHRLDEHIDRLRGSASELGLSDYLDSTALQEAVLATVGRSGLSRARVRLTITAGDLNLLSRAAAQAALGEKPNEPRAEHMPTLMIVAQPATTYPAPMFERGVTITVGETRANPLDMFQGHKTLNYWWRLRELQLAAAKGGAEALLLSVTNHLASGCVSNIMLVKNGVLYTPIARGEEGRASNTPASVHTQGDGPSEPAPTPIGHAQAIRGGAPGNSASRGPMFLASPVMPGIVRQWAIDIAELRGIEVRREMLSISELLAADEVFLTNSSWGVLPVVAVEKAKIGTGTPGPIGTMLLGRWREETYA